MNKFDELVGLLRAVIDDLGKEIYHCDKCIELNSRNDAQDFYRGKKTIAEEYLNKIQNILSWFN